MPITREEKQTIPSLHWHQDEESGTGDLFRGSRWWETSICIEEAVKHIQSWTLRLLCVCLIMYNTWIGPKADVSTVSSEAVSQPIKMVTVVSHKAGHDYMWFRISDLFQLVSAKTKEAGSHLGLGHSNNIRAFFQWKAWIYWLYYKPLNPTLSFIFPFDYYSSATCWLVCNEIQMEKVLAPGPELQLPFSFSFSLGGTSLR